jgi:DNA-binding MarR family transcriptional regulator
MVTPEVVFDRLLEITVLLQKDLARSFEGNGLTLSRTHLLWELHRLGPSTQQSLAAALEVSPRNITGLVDALAATGFVTRSPHPSDRRATLVTLTDLGTRTMAEMSAQRLELSQHLVAGIEHDHLTHLAVGLETITGHLRALVEDAAHIQGAGQEAT